MTQPQHTSAAFLSLTGTIVAVVLVACVDPGPGTRVAGVGRTEPARGGGALHHEPDPYELAVELPACDAADAQTRFIAAAGDWIDINSPAYRLFCVLPGDYRSVGLIELSSSGSETAPRVMRYHDPGNPADATHPANQAGADRAILRKLRLSGANHWVIDGLSLLNDDPDRSLANTTVQLRGSSDDNVLQQLLVEGGVIAVSIDGPNHRNVLQRSVVHDTIETSGDANCINLIGTSPNQELHDNRIVSNEVYDCTDSLQLVVVGGYNDGTLFPGTVVANNDFYLTDAKYVDCSTGARDPNGGCACAEGRFDIKGGGTAAKPVHVTRNRMWGARRTYPDCGGGSSWGGGMTLCCADPSIDYVLIENNIFTDNARGITVASTGSHVTVRDNVVHDTFSPFDGQGVALLSIGITGVEFYRNTVIGAVIWASIQSDDQDLRCNTVIDGGYGQNLGSNVQADYNAYFNSTPMATPGTHDHVGASAAEANHGEHCFVRKRLTAPEVYCIPDVLMTDASPHRDLCDPDLGSRPGMGVDDAPPPPRPQLDDLSPPSAPSGLLVR